jgi:hypothetical protein
MVVCIMIIGNNCKDSLTSAMIGEKTRVLLTVIMGSIRDERKAFPVGGYER